MKKSLILPVIFLLFINPFFLLSLRVISLAPGITEIIFKLNSGERLVGVTKFCDYPEQAKRIQKVGGLIDLNIESIILLKPDIIFHYPEHYEKIKILKNKIRLISVRHTNLSDLFDSIKIISSVLKKNSSGENIVTDIKVKLNNLKLKNINKKRVMIVISRDPFHLRNITIAGKRDFLSEILKYAGGINCYQGDILYPTVSVESVISMNPEVIIEFSFFFNKESSGSISNRWKKFPDIKAVSNKKIFIIKDQFWLRPGPRVAKIAYQLFNLLNK